MRLFRLSRCNAHHSITLCLRFAYFVLGSRVIGFTYNRRALGVTMVTCGLAQQVAMHPMMEPANVKMAEKAPTITMHKKMLSIVLMSSQLCTVGVI